jgi:drug/metabolite transporter (DMT)-like permease
LYNVSLVYLPSSVANLIATLEPAFTAVIAYFLLRERLSVMQIFGSLMILSGVVFLRMFEGKVAGRPKPNGVRLASLSDEVVG